MPSLVVSLAGKPQASYVIDRPRTRIGRWIGSDIVLDSPMVSGAHAMLHVSGARLSIEDLGSSNGTFLGSTRIDRAELDDGSIVRIGDYALKLVADRKAMAYEPTMLVRSSPAARKACLQRLDGTLSGEVIELNKVVSTIGKPGDGVVTFIRRGDDFAVRFTDGPRPLLNGKVLDDAPVRLHPGDILETGTGRLQFVLRESAVPLQEPAMPLQGHPERVQPVVKTSPAPGPLSWLRRAMGRATALER